MDDELHEKLEESTDDAPKESITGEVTADVMPSLGAQLDEAGKGAMDMTARVATASHPETGEQIGEIFVGMSGAFWFDSADGPRVRLDSSEFASMALRMIDDSRFEPETDSDAESEA